MNRIHDYFKKHHIEESDIPKAFVLYKSLGLGVFVTVFTTCYIIKPTQRYMHKHPFNVIPNIFKAHTPILYTGVLNFVDKQAHMLANSKYFKPIPQFLGLDPYATTIALTETALIRKILMPITIPIKFWIIVRWMKNKNEKVNLKEGI